MTKYTELLIAYLEAKSEADKAEKDHEQSEPWYDDYREGRLYRQWIESRSAAREALAELMYHAKSLDERLVNP